MACNAGGTPTRSCSPRQAAPQGQDGRYWITLSAGSTSLYQTGLTPDLYMVINEAGVEALPQEQPLDTLVVAVIVPTTLGGDDRFQVRTLKVQDTRSGATLATWTLPPDADADGVPDSADRCAGTRWGCRVDNAGCAADIDRDGVCDTLDPVTPERRTYFPRMEAP